MRHVEDESEKQCFLSNTLEMFSQIDVLCTYLNSQITLWHEKRRKGRGLEVVIWTLQKGSVPYMAVWCGGAAKLLFVESAVPVCRPLCVWTSEHLSRGSQGYTAGSAGHGEDSTVASSSVVYPTLRCFTHDHIKTWNNSQRQHSKIS